MAVPATGGRKNRPGGHEFRREGSISRQKVMPGRFGGEVGGGAETIATQTDARAQQSESAPANAGVRDSGRIMNIRIQMIRKELRAGAKRQLRGADPDCRSQPTHFPTFVNRFHQKNGDTFYFQNIVINVTGAPDHS